MFDCFLSTKLCLVSVNKVVWFVSVDQVVFHWFLSIKLSLVGLCQAGVFDFCQPSVNWFLSTKLFFIGFCKSSCVWLVSVYHVVWFVSVIQVVFDCFLSTKLFDCFLPSKLLDCDCFCQPVYLNLFMFDCFLSTSLCLTVFCQSVYVWIFSINQVVLHCCCFFLMKLPVFFTTLWKDKNFNILLQLERLMSNRCRGKQQKKIPVISSCLGRKILAHELTFFWKSKITKALDADDFIVYF